MPRITKVYTRTGDDGTTGLGTGARIRKVSPRIEAYGTVDELNAAMGMVVVAQPVEQLKPMLKRIQNELFHLGSDLCVPEADKADLPVPRIEGRHVDALEADLDRLTAELDPLENFILPGGTPAAAHLHLARTICRRAERCVLELAETDEIGAAIVPYLNRLSDLLFVMSRFENHQTGHGDVTWDSHA